METLNDLAAAKPHDDGKRRYTVVEWAIYSAGYYCAIRVMCRALDAAATRYQRTTQMKRLESRRAKQKEGAA